MIGNWQKNKAGILLFILVIFVILCVGTASCNLKKQQQSDPGISFTKIYDKSDGYSYTAVDIKQLSDGGYIVLGKQEKEESRPYVLRLDMEGNALWDTDYDDFSIDGESYIDPVADILVFNQEYYFFCSKVKDGNTYTSLIKLSETVRMPEEIILASKSLNNKYFVVPMNTKKTADGSILLNAIDSLKYKAILLKIDKDGGTIWESKLFTFDKACVGTYPHVDKRYNFIEIVENPGNPGEGIYNYHGYSSQNKAMYPTCFAITTFTPSGPSDVDIDFDNPNTVFLSSRIFIALKWYKGKFFGARIGNNIVSFVVNPELGKDFMESEVERFELNESTPVCIETIDLNDRILVFFVGSAKNNRIVLYPYSLSEGKFMDKRYYGHTHIYEASSLIGTGDNGLAIMGNTYVAGQLGRIYLFKLSKAEIEEMVR
jgi:hypothetical protein